MTEKVPSSPGRRPIEPHEQEPLRELGSLLYYARTEAGLTQWQLASAAGFTSRHMQYLEAGERRPRLSTLTRLADFLAVFLDVDPDGLLELFVGTAGGAIGEETEFPEHDEVRRRSRARRVWFEEVVSERLARTARRRSLPEERRGAATATYRAMRANAGLPETL